MLSQLIIAQDLQISGKERVPFADVLLVVFPPGHLLGNLGI